MWLLQSTSGKPDNGGFFLVLEYVAGSSLADVIAEGPLDPKRALGIARKMAEALAAVHQKGILHRDIKPENTLLAPGDQVKIIDFGLAKVNLERAARRESTREPQTPYCRWGGFRNAGVYGARGLPGNGRCRRPQRPLRRWRCAVRDVGGLPSVRRYVAGRGFPASTPRGGTPIRSRAPGVSVPAGAEAIAMRMLERLPGDRFQTADEVILAIDEALAAIERNTATDDGTAKTLVAPWTPAVVEGERPAVVSPTEKRWPGWALPATAFGSLVIGCAVVLALRGCLAPRADGHSPTARARAAPMLDAAAPVAAASVTPTVASVASPATASAPSRSPPVVIDGIDAAGYRAHLEKAVSIKDWALGARAVVALARLDPTFIDGEGVREQVVVVAAGIGHEVKSDLADAAFNALTSSLGSTGLDVLYELALSRGGTRAGQRARAILIRPGVRERVSPALRVAFDFFVSNCAARRALLERAVEQGDRRVLVQMEVAHGTKCTAKGETCCLYDNPRTANAIARLRAKLAR